MDKLKRKSMPKRSGRGAVIMIAALLLGSSGVRIAAGFGAAFASASDTQPSAEAPHQPEKMPSLAEKTSNAQKERSLDRGQMADLLDALLAREARAEKREKEIERRGRALALADQEIAKRLSVLEEAETALRATLALADTAAEDDLARLTSVYENMKPKDAAALFEEMDPGFAAGFLGRMRPESAASVMAGLSPDKAYSISVILAGRNADVPKT